VGGKFTIQEIPRQVQIIRQQSDAGAAHYHLRSVLDNPALAGAVRALYATPALVPTTPWIDSPPPPRPDVTVDVWRDTARLEWPAAAAKPVRWWLVQTRTQGIWTTDVLPGGRNELCLDHFTGDTIALRAVDRLGNLSAPTMWTRGHSR
jgi:hypothetical protein